MRPQSSMAHNKTRTCLGVESLQTRGFYTFFYKKITLLSSTSTAELSNAKLFFQLTTQFPTITIAKHNVTALWINPRIRQPLIHGFSINVVSHGSDQLIKSNMVVKLEVALTDPKHVREQGQRQTLPKYFWQSTTQFWVNKKGNTQWQSHSVLVQSPR